MQALTQLPIKTDGVDKFTATAGEEGEFTKENF